MERFNLNGSFIKNKYPTIAHVQVFSLSSHISDNIRPSLKASQALMDHHWLMVYLILSKWSECVLKYFGNDSCSVLYVKRSSTIAVHF